MINKNRNYNRRNIKEAYVSDDIYSLLSGYQEDIYELNRTLAKVDRLISELQEYHDKIEEVVDNM